MKIITMTLYNRPDYARSVLAGLRRCEGVSEYLILPHVEPGNEEVISLARGIDFAQSSVTINKARMGTPRNTRAALEHGFSKSNFVVHLEDDVVPAVDGLRYMEFCNDKYAADWKVFSVSGFNRGKPSSGGEYAIAKRPAYCCWFVGWWKNRFEGITRGNKWPMTEKFYSVQINALLKGAALEIYPLLSRSQNIGVYGGVGGTRDKSTAHWSQDLKSGKYFEVELSRYKAPLLPTDPGLARGRSEVIKKVAREINSRPPAPPVHVLQKRTDNELERVTAICSGCKWNLDWICEHSGCRPCKQRSAGGLKEALKMAAFACPAGLHLK